VRRYAECNNVVLLAVGFKFFGVVAIVAVKDKQPIFALRTRYYMEIKIPNPIHTFLISNPAIISYCNTPISWKVALSIPIGEVILPGQNDEWRNSLAQGVYSLDNCSPLSIARLGLFGLAAAVRGSDYYSGDNNTHYKAGFVEVVYIVIEDPVFNLYIVYKRKLLANNFWIFVFGPLVVVFTRKTYPKFWLALDEVVSLSYAHFGRVAFV